MSERNDLVRGWYPSGEITRDDAESWYAASGGTLAPVPDAEERRIRSRKRRRTRIIAVVLCVALLVSAAGTVLVRALREARTLTAAVTPHSEERQALPEDFREYFENYYNASDTVEIPRVSGNDGTRLVLLPRTGEALTLQEIYEKVSPAVVGVVSLIDGMGKGWGTGVAFTPDGYIITNTHILEGCNGVLITLADGREFPALLVGADSLSDIAVLKIECGSIPFAEFGDSDEMCVGDPVAAIGNPLGPQYAGTMTNGIVSAIERNVRKNGHTMELMQTNAALNEGNSGGPLVNDHGQVVGITNMKIMNVLYTTVEGIGFAIPSGVVRDVANELLTTGAVSGHPVIGITAGSVSDEARERYGMPQGVYVTNVNEASMSGLKVGDVILDVNDVKVTTVAAVNAVKDDFGVGEKLNLRIWRDGDILNIVCILIDETELK